jgi:hypothetical protein
MSSDGADRHQHVLGADAARARSGRSGLGRSTEPERVGLMAMNDTEVLQERWEQLLLVLFAGRVFVFDRAAAL